MAGLGRKTFSPGDVLTSSDVQGYLMDQSVMVFAGTAARASAIPSPSAGMVAYSTATALQVYNGSAWVDLSTGYGVATGGTSSSITVSGINYTLLTFTSDSTLTVTKSGLFDCLIFSGAGGGAAGIGSGVVGGGGGGAGGSYLQSTVYLSANATIKIGAGGAGGPASETSGTRGSLSAVGTTFIEGGASGLPDTNAFSDQRNYFGVSTGGASAQGNTTSLTSSVGTTYNGYRGGNGTASLSGGGGGGASTIADGGASSVGTGGTGGTGYDVSAFISGSALVKGSGGGGGGGVSGPGGTNAGAGGAGVNGTGGTASANTASGGGAGSGAGLGGAGGSGIIYVRFKV